ncbi:MAG: transglutaminase family protein [Mariniphaga sp.]
MPIYQITYSTENTYSPDVHEVLLEFLVLPESGNGQSILESQITTEPMLKPYLGDNIFGFQFLRYRMKGKVTGFQFSVKILVSKEVVNPYGFISLPLSEEREILYSNSFAIDNYPFLDISPFTSLPYGYEIPVIGESEGAFDFINRINGYIHDFLKYDQDIKDPSRKLARTLAEKCGVCQDFAHLMLAILRHNNIPSRYVSGYLDQGENTIGAGAVHAWIQALIPGIGWLGFDPTNNLLEDHHYIKIAHGVDISSCTAIKGVVKGYGSNQTNYHVLVEEQNKESNQ